MQSPLQFQTEQQPRSQLLVPKPLVITPLLITAEVVYTADPVADFWIVHLWASNVSGSAATYSLHIVPPSVSASAINAMVVGKSLAANTSEVVAVAVNQRMPPGHTLQALSSANGAINLGGWGYDFFGEYA